MANRVWVYSNVAGGVVLPNGLVLSPNDPPIDLLWTDQLSIMEAKKLIKVRRQKQKVRVRTEVKNGPTEMYKDGYSVYVATRED